MPVIWTPPAPVPDSVSSAGSDCAPTRVGSKFSAVADTLKAGAGPPRPVPARVSVGGALPVDATCSDALLSPAEAGAKRTSIVQVWPSNSGVPITQLPAVTENAAASAPSAFSTVRFTPPGPWLSSVSDCAADTVPADTGPKSSRETAGDH